MIEFTKLSEVPSVEEIPEGSSVLIETENEIKRAPADVMGGGPMVYYNVMLTAETQSSEPIITGDCPRSSEVVALMEAGKFPMVYLRQRIGGVIRGASISHAALFLSEEGTDYISFDGYAEMLLVDDGTSSHWEYDG